MTRLDRHATEYEVGLRIAAFRWLRDQVALLGEEVLPRPWPSQAVEPRQALPDRRHSKLSHPVMACLGRSQSPRTQ